VIHIKYEQGDSRRMLRDRTGAADARQVSSVKLADDASQ
jgi:hypothetical protein